MRKALGIFLVAVACCAAFLSWTSFPDPDAFYHANAALLLWRHGSIHAFPWLDLTTLGTGYMDQHFLFHVIEAPFVALFGLHLGARILALFLAAACVTTCYLLLRWMKVRHAEVWALLLLATSPLMVRLLLAKASPLAIILFVLGLAATWKRKPFLVAFIAFLFALTHGGWVYLIGSIVLMGIGDVLYRFVMEERKSIIDLLSKPYLLSFGAACVGVTIGLLVHPNFPQDFSLLWVQVVKIGLQTLRLLNTPMEKLLLVLNRSNSKVKLDIGEVERTLQAKADALVPSDVLIPQSVNKGVPVVLHAPKSAVARSLVQLAEQFTNAPTQARRR